MTWLSLVLAFVKLANLALGYASDRQLMDAGAAKAIAVNLQGTIDAIDKAMAARRAVQHDVQSIANDPDNRDGK